MCRRGQVSVRVNWVEVVGRSRPDGHLRKPQVPPLQSKLRQVLAVGKEGDMITGGQNSNKDQNVKTGPILTNHKKRGHIFVQLTSAKDVLLSYLSCEVLI